jgi:chromosome segregation ATPase
MATSALLTFKEERHEYHHQVISFISAALAAKRKHCETVLSEQSSLINDPDGERTNREKQVESAAATVESLTSSTAEARAELKRLVASAQATREAAEAAKRASKALMKTNGAIESEKAELNDATHLLCSACGTAALNRILKLAKQLKCDKAMLVALPTAVKHGEEERTEFQKMTVSSVRERIAEKVAELSASMEEGRPAREEQEQRIHDAENACVAADEAAKAAQASLGNLQNQLTTARQELKAADKKRSLFLLDMKRLMDGFDKTKAELAELVDGPVQDFAVLEAYTAPPAKPEAPAEKPLPEDALGTAQSGADPTVCLPTAKPEDEPSVAEEPLRRDELGTAQSGADLTGCLP